MGVFEFERVKKVGWSIDVLHKDKACTVLDKIHNASVHCHCGATRLHLTHFPSLLNTIELALAAAEIIGGELSADQPGSCLGAVEHPGDSHERGVVLEVVVGSIH